MSLRALIDKLASDNGVEVDPDELEMLGLGEDGDSLPRPHESVDLSAPLPGSASGAVEVFLSTPSTAVKPVEEGGLLWSPIAVEGQWALRPDGKGGKKRVPLKIVAGSSADQRRQIGLKDIVDAFADGAMEQVTLPESHNNRPTENHGYVQKLKIVDGKGKKGSVKVLMAGEDVTEPETRKKMLNGSVRGRSMGLLFDYFRTDTGKRYPVALEHVALTPKPWLRGMPRLTRPLAQAADLQTVPLSLSDIGPDERQYEIILADAVDVEDQDGDFLAETAATWSHEDDPEWLRQQVNDILRVRRQEKFDKRKGSPLVGVYVEDRLPSYHCQRARPGLALIADGYGEDANFWTAPISVVDGVVQIGELSSWSATKKVWMPDERKMPTGDQAPLSDDNLDQAEDLTPLQAARHDRHQRGLELAHMGADDRKKFPVASFAVPEEKKFPIHDEASARASLSNAAGTKYEPRVRAAVKKKYPDLDIKPKTKTNDPPRGGGSNMAESTNTLQLSEEARELIKKAEDRAAAAERVAEGEKAERLKLSEKVDKLLGTNAVNTTAQFIGELKLAGLDEEHGFGGMLVEIEAAMLADDGEPALQSAHFADDDNKDGTLCFGDALRRIFGAIKRAEDGTIALGEIITPLSEVKEDDAANKNAGKPPKDLADSEKPIDYSNMSDDDIIAQYGESDPAFLAELGIKVPEKVAQNGASK